MPDYAELNVLKAREAMRNRGRTILRLSADSA